MLSSTSLQLDTYLAVGVGAVEGRGTEQKSIQEAEDVARRRKAKTKENRPPKKINVLIRAPVA